MSLAFPSNVTLYASSSIGKDTRSCQDPVMPCASLTRLMAVAPSSGIVHIRLLGEDVFYLDFQFSILAGNITFSSYVMHEEDDDTDDTSPAYIMLGHAGRIKLGSSPDASVSFSWMTVSATETLKFNSSLSTILVSVSPSSDTASSIVKNCVFTDLTLPEEAKGIVTDANRVEKTSFLSVDGAEALLDGRFLVSVSGSTFKSNRLRTFAGGGSPKSLGAVTYGNCLFDSNLGLDNSVSFLSVVGGITESWFQNNRGFFSLVSIAAIPSQSINLIVVDFEDNSDLHDLIIAHNGGDISIEGCTFKNNFVNDSIIRSDCDDEDHSVETFVSDTTFSHNVASTGGILTITSDQGCVSTLDVADSSQIVDNSVGGGAIQLLGAKVSGIPASVVLVVGPAQFDQDDSPVRIARNRIVDDSSPAWPTSIAGIRCGASALLSHVSPSADIEMNVDSRQEISEGLFYPSDILCAGDTSQMTLPSGAFLCQVDELDLDTSVAVAAICGSNSDVVLDSVGGLDDWVLNGRQDQGAGTSLVCTSGQRPCRHLATGMTRLQEVVARESCEPFENGCSLALVGNGKTNSYDLSADLGDFKVAGGRIGHFQMHAESPTAPVVVVTGEHLFDLDLVTGIDFEGKDSTTAVLNITSVYGVSDSTFFGLHEMYVVVSDSVLGHVSDTTFNQVRHLYVESPRVVYSVIESSGPRRGQDIVRSPDVFGLDMNNAWPLEGTDNDDTLCAVGVRMGDSVVQSTFETNQIPALCVRVVGGESEVSASLEELEFRDNAAVSLLILADDSEAVPTQNYTLSLDDVSVSESCLATALHALSPASTKEVSSSQTMLSIEAGSFVVEGNVIVMESSSMPPTGHLFVETATSSPYQLTLRLFDQSSIISNLGTVPAVHLVGPKTRLEMFKGSIVSENECHGPPPIVCGVECEKGSPSVVLVGTDTTIKSNVDDAKETASNILCKTSDALYPDYTCNFDGASTLQKVKEMPCRDYSNPGPHPHKHGLSPLAVVGICLGVVLIMLVFVIFVIAAIMLILFQKRGKGEKHKGYHVVINEEES